MSTGPVELDHGTRHHDYMHRTNNYIRLIKGKTNNIDVHSLLDDYQEIVEKYVMSNIPKFGKRKNEKG